MLSKFFAYSGYDYDVTREIWSNAIISLDTNTLLNTYKMTPDARSQFLRVLQTLKDRLWMPFQVGKEFYSNRRFVIEEELKSLQNTKLYYKRNLETLAAGVEKSAIRFRAQLSADLQKELNDLKDRILIMIEQYPDKMDRKEYFDGHSLKAEDPISKELFEIFGLNVGDGFNPEELMKIYEEGEKRYSVSIPPGFEDAVKKQDYRKYGDLVIWKELMKRAIEKAKPIIFITEDVKPDWWERNNEFKRPHPELLNEFHKQSGQLIYIYTYNEFIEQATALISNFPETTKVAEEIKAINEEERERAREPVEVFTPKPGDIYSIMNYYLFGDKIRPVLLCDELENGSFYAFPITSRRDSFTIKHFPTVYCAGKLAAVLVDRKIIVRLGDLRSFYDRIDQQQLLNVFRASSQEMYNNKDI